MLALYTNSKIVAFDLSTSCTGVSVGTIRNSTLTSITTQAIIPQNIKPSTLGYLNTKKIITTKKGEQLRAYLVTKDEIITKTEKERRDREVKKASEEARITFTTTEIQQLLKTVRPDLILMEANMSFRNMDVTRKLAEVSGVLTASAISAHIPLEKVNVHTARSLWNLSKESSLYAKTLPISKLKTIDLTKETLKHLVLKAFAAYNLEGNITLDESDALVLLHWWLKEHRLKF